MNIFVSNLGFHLESEDLKRLFFAYGKVTSAKVITDREINRSKGFGFVELVNESDGETAIKKLHGSVLDSRSLNVNVAKHRDQR